MLPSLIAGPRLDDLAALAATTPAGDFVEVGVYQGGSAWRLAEVARRQARRLFLFDTWEGMPYANPAIDRHAPGEFWQCSIEEVKKAIPDANCIKGIFPDTLPDDVKEVAFCHVDCDQYQSVRDTILALRPRMVVGGIMLFDDYDDLEGARCAVDELLGGSIIRRSFLRPYVKF